MPKISDLEKVLADARKAHGDAELVFWDQDWCVSMNPLDSIVWWDREERRLYVGGFQENGEFLHNISPE